MITHARGADRFVNAIRQSGLSIYDPLDANYPDLWIPGPDLQHLLNEALSGISLAGMPLRTRSKAVKEHVCRALGYSVPDTFTKTQPRFPGQSLDIYVQKSQNLQIWNEDIEWTRRYAIIRVSSDDIIERVRVVTGEMLTSFDTTGTLTRKHQARLTTGPRPRELISPFDTELLRDVVQSDVNLTGASSPADPPDSAKLMPIGLIYRRLLSLVGESFPDAGSDQERNRGATLHRLVCTQLGYSDYHDDGQFPDIRHQLLEVKLQTSPTIDLGLLRPDSKGTLGTPSLAGRLVRVCDVRYALFYGNTDGNMVELTHLFLTTGEDFPHRFPYFQGNVSNQKRQLKLPNGFFD